MGCRSAQLSTPRPDGRLGLERGADPAPVDPWYFPGTQEYRARLAARRRVVESQRHAERNFSAARLVVFLTGAALLVPVLFWETLHWGWLELPAAAFAALLRAHESAIRRRERAEPRGAGRAP